MAKTQTKARALMFLVFLKRTGWKQINLLPLLPPPVFENMEVQVVESLGICVHCPAASTAHILWHRPGTRIYDKLCPILFIDYVRPGFELKDIV